MNLASLNDADKRGDKNAKSRNFNFNMGKDEVAEPVSKKSSSDGRVKRVNPDKSKTTYILLVLLAIAIIAIGAAIYLFMQNNQLKQKADNPIAALDEQSKQIKDKVSKLILLTDSDQISVKSITDVESLKKDNADFFKDAKNGEYVLVSDKRAIIYDNDTNMIVNVAPIIPSSTSTQPQATSTPLPIQTTTPVPTTTAKK